MKSARGKGKGPWAGLRMPAYVAAMALCCGLATLVSFHLVRHVLLGPPGSAPREKPSVLEARTLRAHSNELNRLASEYLNALRADEAACSPAFKDWARHEYLPRLNAFRRKMMEALDGSRVRAQLLRASDLVAAMAGNPDAAHLRRSAVEAVSALADAVDARIDALGASKLVSEARRGPLPAIPD